MHISEIEAHINDLPEPICRCGHHGDFHDLDGDYGVWSAKGYHGLAPCQRCECLRYRPTQLRAIT
jgi:hypothetical protein